MSHNFSKIIQLESVEQGVKPKILVCSRAFNLSKILTSIILPLKIIYVRGRMSSGLYKKTYRKQ